MTLHLISGLPRSGSTLLSGILRQNPRFAAAIQSPLADVVMAAMRAMSGSESAMFISPQQRHRVLQDLIQSYYSHFDTDRVVFDSNRAWCAVLPAVAELLPGSRVLCCVRSPAWILDSVERLVQKNALLVSTMFNHEVGNVYTRVEAMATKQFLAPSLNALRQAWSSEHAERLIAIRYDSLVQTPAAVMAQLYALLGETGFDHDFTCVDYSEPEFDDRLGLPGLHTVSGAVAPRPRKTILPEDLFKMYDQEFWGVEGGNPRSVAVL